MIGNLIIFYWIYRMIHLKAVVVETALMQTTADLHWCYGDLSSCLERVLLAAGLL
jgi:hypothetical protein